MEVFRAKYREEATELIESIEKSLLLLENNVDDAALIKDVFRDMHTLKGNSSMFGFKMIADITHHLESMYDLVRSGKMKMSEEILNVTFSALDHLSALVGKEDRLTEKETVAHEAILSKITGIIHYKNPKGNNVATEPDNAESISPENELITYNIKFAPNRDFFLNGNNPLNLLKALYQFGTCEAAACTADIPALENCDADSCYTSWDIHLQTNTDINTIKEIFAFVEHLCSLKIDRVSYNSSLPATVMKLESYDEGPDGSIKKSSPVPGTEKEDGAIRPKKIISGIRVPSERLDTLMSLISELMTLQGKLAMLTEQNPQAGLLSVSENLEKISNNLRDNAFNMCLVPLENMITPFRRLIRDLTAELNKEIEFISEGTETELDKNIIEALSDVVMHLLRNSVDHGIEYPEQRIQSGKPRRGKILFRAYRTGANVYIEIQDDGKGMDPQAIRKKALEKGIITAENNLNDKEILNVVFLAGFSTAEKVSGISGRGVGMDVVKRKITDMRGHIRLNSREGDGTSVTIKLPITTSIIDGLLVKINHADFVIPLSVVDRCYEVTGATEVSRLNNLIVLNGEQIPFISLPDEFDTGQTHGLLQEMVIVYYEEKKVGLIVDRVVGKFQAVLKPVGKYFQKMDNISAATILGDGKVALVLDTNSLIEQFSVKKGV